jgi:hypothetical protein
VYVDDRFHLNLCESWTNDHEQFEEQVESEIILDKTTQDMSLEPEAPAMCREPRSRR